MREGQPEPAARSGAVPQSSRSPWALRLPRSGVLLAGVLALVTLGYAGALRGPFLWDDFSLIPNQPLVAELHAPHEYFLRMFWANPEHPQSRTFYRPLTTLSYALEYRLWGPEPLPFHVTNLLFHLACCALLFGLCRRAGGGPGACALAALLWGLYPRLTESVAWISGRTDVLAGVGALGGWLLHRTENERSGRRVAAAAAIGLGLLCKEVAIAGAVAIAALELAARRRAGSGWARTARHLAPLAVVGVIYVGLRVIGWEISGSHMPQQGTFPLPKRAGLFAEALGTYAWVVLDALRPRLQIGTLGLIDWRFAALGVAVGGSFLLLMARMLRPGVRDMQRGAVALALAALFPVLHLIPLPLNVVAADRFLYLPLAGAAVALACAASSLGPRRRRAALAAALIAAPAFFLATVARNEAWADELALWRAAVANAPRDNSLPYSGLGEALFRRDRYAAALENFQKAYAVHERLRRHDPIFVELDTALGNSALCLGELGRYDEALPILRHLVATRPRMPINHFNLGLVHARLLRFDEAERALQAALELYPEYPRAHKLREQIAEAREILAALPPERPEEPVEVTAQRAVAYTKVGRRDRADSLWSRVVDSPGASEADLRRAALFLVLRGDKDSAARGVARLKELPGRREEASQLEKALVLRIVEERAREASG